MSLASASPVFRLRTSGGVDTGGNLDFKMLTAGTSLFLPVFHSGARFYVGDPHGNGTGRRRRASGNALEQSLTGDFRFVVHKGKTITAPRAETDTHYVMMGIDLDRALRLATLEVINFLVTEKKLTASKALSLASLAVDFHIAEAVDGTQVVVGKIPKSIFKS